jgi:hypothetical protein
MFVWLNVAVVRGLGLTATATATAAGTGTGTAKAKPSGTAWLDMNLRKAVPLNETVRAHCWVTRIETRDGERLKVFMAGELTRTRVKNKKREEEKEEEEEKEGEGGVEVPSEVEVLVEASTLIVQSGEVYNTHAKALVQQLPPPVAPVTQTPAPVPRKAAL